MSDLRIPENQLTSFSHETFGSVRTLIKDGEPWFVAADVCKVLGHTNPTVALQMLDEDEKTKQSLGQLSTNGVTQNRESNIISEAGLYSLVIRSNVPGAKAFKRWITHEVIPQIRKTGAYLSPVIDSDMLFKMAEAMAAKEKQIKELEQQKALMSPKADFYDAVVESPDAVDMAVAAKTLNMGIGRNTMFKILRDEGILQNNNIPYQEYVDRGYFRCIESKFSMPDGSTHVNIKTVVHQKGLDFIRKTIRKRNQAFC